MKLQKRGIGVEPIIAMTHASDDIPEWLPGSVPGSRGSLRRQPVETPSDHEYTKAMEERRGIREAGIIQI